MPAETPVSCCLTRCFKCCLFYTFCCCCCYSKEKLNTKANYMLRFQKWMVVRHRTLLVTRSSQSPTKTYPWSNFLWSFTLTSLTRSFNSRPNVASTLTLAARSAMIWSSLFPRFVHSCWRAIWDIFSTTSCWTWFWLRVKSTSTLATVCGSSCKQIETRN